MRELLLVGCGGFLGAVARYGMSRLLAPRTAHFPIATLVVNVSGCLLIGWLAGWGQRTELLTPTVRLFVLTGILGGYTTFSAFGLESHALLRGGATGAAILNVASHMVLGLLAVALGHRLGSV